MRIRSTSNRTQGQLHVVYRNLSLPMITCVTTRIASLQRATRRSSLWKWLLQLSCRRAIHEALCRKGAIILFLASYTSIAYLKS